MWRRAGPSCARAFACAVLIGVACPALTSGAPNLSEPGGWRPLAAKPTARTYAAAGVVDGKLHFLGGFGVFTNGNYTNLATMEVYDPENSPDKWFMSTSMPTARANLAAGVVDGKLYAVGGYYTDGETDTNLSTVEVYDPTANTWAAVAPMPTARANLAAGVVDGKLYALGGSADEAGTKLSTVEVYDPATDTWTTVAPMPTARGFLATGVVDGKLYALGGSSSTDDDNAIATVEMYDPATNTWAAVAPMPTARSNLAAGVMDGKLYAVGGYYTDDETDTNLSTVEVYDPAANTWATAAPMPTARASLAAGVMGGNLYAVGGEDDDQNPLNVVEMLPSPPQPPPQPSHGAREWREEATWAAVAPMPTARSDLAAGMLEGKLYALGGYIPRGDSFESINTVEMYDPAANKWAAVAPMPTARANLAAGVMDGKLYTLGGYESVSGSGDEVRDTVEKYDPATNTWAAMAPMPTARASLATGVVDGKLYAVGGEDSGGLRLDTVEKYDPATNTWAAVAPMPTARANLALGVVGGKLYAAGGADDNDNLLATVEEYDPPSNTWAAVAPMSTARSFLAAGVVDDMLFALGGFGDVEAFASVEMYDPATNVWATVAPMPTARSNLAAGVIDGKLYALGGDDGVADDPLGTVVELGVRAPAPSKSSPKIRYAVVIGAAAGGAALLASLAAAAFYIKRRRQVYRQQVARLTMARSSASPSLASV